MKISRRLTAALLAATMLGVLVGQGAVLAADPKPVVTPNKGDLLVGIADDLQGKTPEQLGYTQEYVDWKEAQVAAFAASLGAADGIDTAAASGYLNGYVQYHQKTDRWCLSAIVQTILRFKLGNAWITPSVLSKQTAIFNQIGEYESQALPYLNQQLAPTGFQYTAVEPKPNLTTFRLNIATDINTFVVPTYVAVNVGNQNHVWWQYTARRHASAALGFGTSTDFVRIGDPYTSPDYSPGCTLGASNPGYSSTPNYGCVYGAWPMWKYHDAALAQWY